MGSTLATTYINNTGLTNGITYYYVVRAINAGGSSAASNEASATPLAPPSAPTDVAAVAGDGQVTLSWTAPADTATFTVYVATSSGGPYTSTLTNPAKAAGQSEQVTIAPLTNGTTYYFVVRVFNSGGASADSNEASATPLAPPSAPTG